MSHSDSIRDKVYFASDLHLGTPSRTGSLARERHFVRWLDLIRDDCRELYLLGDVFDFWFEYKRAVPKGYVRILGKLAELSDAGVKIHYFAGNHDLWLGDYFTEQLGADIYFAPIVRAYYGKTFLLAHGDGLGPGDQGYKFMKRIFRNPVAQWLFHRLHPNLGIGLADFLSRWSRRKTGHKDAIDYGEKEFLIIYSREQLQAQPEIDYLVFGHRHLPRQIELETNKFYVNLGDWISHFTYLEADASGVRLMHFPRDGQPVPFAGVPAGER
ncbi:MAG: UDP-2,3-diacylglucosamine diphosphatase [Bacteroidota bacterium]